MRGNYFACHTSSGKFNECVDGCVCMYSLVLCHSQPTNKRLLSERIISPPRNRRLFSAFFQEVDLCVPAVHKEKITTDHSRDQMTSDHLLDTSWNYDPKYAEVSSVIRT